MVLTEKERKERKAISDKKWRDANKEKITIRNKIYKDANKEKISLYNKQYEIDNKEKKAARSKKYREDNHKNIIIYNWKYQGIIDDDYDLLYEYFITQTNCWICDKVYNNDIVADRRCLDHDNTLLNEPNVRYICCWNCNINTIR